MNHSTSSRLQNRSRSRFVRRGLLAALFGLGLALGAAQVAVPVVSACRGHRPSPKVVFSPSQAMKRPVGSRVTVEGVADAGRNRICTQRYCGPKNPCCNACGASLVLRDPSGPSELRLVRKGGASYSCGGSSCALTCQPLTKGQRYRVVGILRAGGKLEVISFTPVKPAP